MSKKQNMQPIAVPKGLTQSCSRPFFNRAVGRTFEVRASEKVTEIELYDEIGFWGVSAAEFKRQLNATNGGDIVLKVNSPGGDVFDGIAMYNDLIRHPGNVTVEVTGLAASAASYIIIAADTIRIAENAFLMIHNAWTLAVGDRHQMLKVSEFLEEIDGAILDTYAARTGLEPADIENMMDEETWLRADEAIEQRFADEPIALASPSAKFDLSTFNHAPEGIGLSSVPHGEKKTIRDAERALRDAGFSKQEAKTKASLAFASPLTNQRDADEDEMAGCIEALIGLRNFTQTLIKGE